MVADRLFGPERTLLYSAVLILFGHIALAVLPGVTGVAVGLVCVALGSGGLKSTATVLVGKLYAVDDDRRDAGFSIFYMGVNIGALAGPLLTGLLQDKVGFHWGFGLAAVVVLVMTGVIGQGNLAIVVTWVISVAAGVVRDSVEQQAG